MGRDAGSQSSVWGESMIGNIDYQDAGTSLSAPKYDRSREPMPSREELLKRNSFGSVNDNKYLNRQQLEANGELERSQATQKRWGLCK